MLTRKLFQSIKEVIDTKCLKELIHLSFKVTACKNRELPELCKCGWMGLFDHLLSRCAAPRLLLLHLA